MNVSNDVEDAARGADPPDKDRNSGLFNTGRLTIATGRRLYGGCFAAAALLGIGICAVQGPALLVIGWIGILGGLLYTAGPVPYKYLGLGEVAIVMLMGPLITLGTFTAVTGRAFAAMGFWIGLGPGLLIAAVLAANNLTDIVVDTAAGARTVAVRIGFPRARLLYLRAARGHARRRRWRCGSAGCSARGSCFPCSPHRHSHGAAGSRDQPAEPATRRCCRSRRPPVRPTCASACCSSRASCSTVSVEQADAPARIVARGALSPRTARRRALRGPSRPRCATR